MHYKIKIKIKQYGQNCLMTLQHENICFDSGENSCKLIGCYCQELQMMCGLDG